MYWWRCVKTAFWLGKINEKLNKIYEKMPFPTPRVKVTTCKYNNDSNLIGALYNYIQHDKGNKL